MHSLIFNHEIHHDEHAILRGQSTSSVGLLICQLFALMVIQPAR